MVEATQNLLVPMVILTAVNEQESCLSELTSSLNSSIISSTFLRTIFFTF